MEEIETAAGDSQSGAVGAVGARERYTEDNQFHVRPRAKPSRASDNGCTRLSRGHLPLSLSLPLALL